MITAINVAVAFQTMAHTVGMSCSETAPTARAITAPNVALQPTPNPLGCQMTSTRVKTKTAKASNISKLSNPDSAAGSFAHRTSVHVLQAGDAAL